MGEKIDYWKSSRPLSDERHSKQSMDWQSIILEIEKKVVGGIEEDKACAHQALRLIHEWMIAFHSLAGTASAWAGLLDDVRTGSSEGSRDFLWDNEYGLISLISKREEDPLKTKASLKQITGNLASPPLPEQTGQADRPKARGARKNTKKE